MTPEFKAQMRNELKAWRDNGVSAVDAARNLERICGKANEDYGVLVRLEGRRVAEGQALVEDVYDGVLAQLAGGNGLVFSPNTK